MRFSKNDLDHSIESRTYIWLDVYIYINKKLFYFIIKYIMIVVHINNMIIFFVLIKNKCGNSILYLK